MKAPRKITGMAVMIGAIFALFTSGKDAFGQLDPTFHPPYFAVPDFASRALLLPDGKYVVYVNVETLSDQPTGAITRYLADGTLDTSFNFSRDYQSVFAAAALPDGKLIVAAAQFIYGLGANDQNHQIWHILRLNADGSIDSSFDSNARTTDGPVVRAIGIQPDGKILVGGIFTAFNGSPRRGIVRLLPDGTVDPNFAALTMTDPPMPLGGISGLWTEPRVQADGKILIAGDFIGVNGTPCPGVARLNADGSLDSTFQASGFVPTNSTTPRPIRGIAIQSNGQIVIGGKFTVGPDFASNHTGMTYTKLPLIRLNSDGSADQSYGYFGSMDTADSTFAQIRALVMQLDGKVVAVANSVFRFNTDSSLDTTFRQPDLLVDRSANVNFDREAFAINLRSDGRILIGGDFSDVDDAPPLPANGERWGVAQFNSDGTLDSFTTSHRQAYNAYPTSFLRQADGSTLIAFNQYGGFSGKLAIPHNYGRLLPGGSLDTSFDPLGSIPLLNLAAGTVGFSTLPDGDILVFGINYFLTGNFGYDVLKPDGTIADPNYTDDPNVGFDKAYPLTNGQVLVVNSTGAQSVVNNTELQRLNSNGSLDASFVLDASIVANREQRDVSGNLQTVATGSAVLALFSDGKILFAYLAADSTYRLVRLNPNGSLDSTFQPGSVPVSTTSYSALVHDPQNNTNPLVTVLTPNGVPGFSGAQLVAGNQLVVVGQFASYAGVPAHGIIRLNGDGSVDGTFQAGNGAQWTQTVETTTFHPSIDNIEQAGNAKFLITGTFEAFNGVPLPGIALLQPDGSLDTSFVPPATRRKFDYHTAYLATQPDNSFLLSGPYSLPNQTQSPSFIHIFGAPVITSPPTATATQDQLFVYQVTATGTPTSYSATPLPPGLTFDSAHGILGGSPTDPVTTQIQLTASNAFGTGTATLTLTVQPAPPGPVIASGTSITARTGALFSFEVFTTGGSATARLSATGLPPGLSVDPVTGIISGIPTADGSFGVILTVTDGAVTNTFTLELTFTSDPAIPVIISPRETALAAGQFFTYTIVAPSSDHSGTTFSLIGTLPSGLVFDAATGTISGTYNSHFQNGGALLGNVQLIASNSSGTATSTLNFFQQVSSAAKNISTRLAVGTGDNVLIGGIIIQGNAPKKVIIRAIGPELTQYGVPGALQDPTLELHDGSGALIGQNDNWGTTILGGVITSDQVAEIQATGLAPGDSHESAIISTLQPGNYTAIIRGEPDGTTGVALVEVYDLGTASLDVSSNAQLGNISTRGLVQTGDNVMIGGFIVRGELPATVIVRAIGPSLTAFGVPGALQDPTLELHDVTGAVIGGNDNWQDDPGAAQIQADNLAPSDPRESATIVTLAPGNYTAIVRGTNDTTGVALVEAFVLQ